MKRRTRVMEKVDVFNDSSFVVPGIKRRTRVLEKVDALKIPLSLHRGLATIS